jgi:hypothetical protein
MSLLRKMLFLVGLLVQRLASRQLRSTCSCTCCGCAAMPRDVATHARGNPRLSAVLSYKFDWVQRTNHVHPLFPATSASHSGCRLPPMLKEPTLLFLHNAYSSSGGIRPASPPAPLAALPSFVRDADSVSAWTILGAGRIVCPS